MEPIKIDLNKISFAYDNENVINDVACSFSSGHFYSIIGPNGSGKTTLLDLIFGFFSPVSGSISLDGHLLSSLSKKELSRTIALVSQDYSINFPFSVEEVMLMGRHPYIPRFSQPSIKDFDKVKEVMTLCHINHLSKRRINELSGGERQRCIFARALCQDTPVLLLDEAFSNMDINHTLQMLKLVKQAVKAENKMVLSVFHDLNLASSWSDKILMLKDGRVKAFGDSQSVMTAQNIQTVFGVSAIVEPNPHVNAKQVYYPTN
jgi:iron complex transport system ATP-binding protein